MELTCGMEVLTSVVPPEQLESVWGAIPGSAVFTDTTKRSARLAGRAKVLVHHKRCDVELSELADFALASLACSSLLTLLPALAPHVSIPSLLRLLIEVHPTT